MMCAKEKNKQHNTTINPADCTTFFSWGKRQYRTFFLLNDTSNSDRHTSPSPHLKMFRHLKTLTRTGLLSVGCKHMQSLSAGHHVLQATWSDSDNTHEDRQSCTISLETEGEVVPGEQVNNGEWVPFFFSRPLPG